LSYDARVLHAPISDCAARSPKALAVLRGDHRPAVHRALPDAATKCAAVNQTTHDLNIGDNSPDGVAALAPTLVFAASGRAAPRAVSRDVPRPVDCTVLRL
jgi:hypothetical protein